MRRGGPVAGVLLLFSLMCVGPAASRTSRDLLPNLVELPPSDIAVGKSGAVYELRFTSTAGNNGAGPLELRASRAKSSARFAVVQRIALAGVGTRTRKLNVLLRFQSASGHDHFHLARFERYELVTASGDVVARDSKAGYCLGDRAKLGTPAGAPRFIAQCGLGKRSVLRLTEGISPGWADPYDATLAGQSFRLSGLPGGDYFLVNRVNDQGSYLESSYTDNVAAAKLRLAWPDGPSGEPAVTVLGVCFAERC